MRKLLTIAALALSVSAAACKAQNISANTVTVTKNLTFQSTDAVPQITEFSGSPSVLGTTPYFYWFVSRTGSNFSPPAGPLLIYGPSTLNAVQNIGLNWIPIGGTVTSYDVLRTTSSTAPTGACNCAVAIATALTTVTDTGAALQTYTVSPNGANWVLGSEMNGGQQELVAIYTGVPGGQLYVLAPPTGGGSGLPFQNQGTPIGTATTVNCFTNLTCSFSSGTVTITASGGGGGNNLCTNNPAPGAYTPTNTAGAVDCLTAGTYTLPNSVTTITASNVTIRGMTPGVIVQRGGASSGIKFQGNADRIIGVTLDQDAVTSTANFLEMDGNDGVARNLIVQNPGTTSSAFATIAIANTNSRVTVDDVRFFGIQVDSCVAVNPAGSGASAIAEATVENVTVSFGPSTAENCIWINQVSGSTALDITWDHIWVNANNTNGTPFAVTGQAAVQNTANARHHFSNLTAKASAVAPRLIHIFGCNWCTLTDFAIDDGGQGVSGAALDLGDFYNSTVKGMAIKASAGLESGIACVDCEFDTITGNTINGIGNGDDGIFLGNSAAPAEFNTISGNVVTLGFNGTCYFIQSNGNPAGFNNLFGNTCAGTGAAGQLGILLTNTSGGLAHTLISGNMFEALSGSGDVGITVGSGVTSTQIADELFDAVTTHITNSGTLTTIAALDTGPVAGTLSSGTATVTLPATFSAVGDATCNASDTTTPGTAINATLATTTTVTVKGTGTDAFVVACRGF